MASHKVRAPRVVAAFKRDWRLGVPLKEMAAMYGFKTTASVTRVARSLNLPKRSGGGLRDPHALRHGEWVRQKHGIYIWKDYGVRRR